MKVPEQTHSGSMNRSKIVADPQEGSRASGKSNDEEATLRKGNLPKSEAVTTAKFVDGAHAAAIKPQLGEHDDTRRTPSNSPDGAGSI
jgi:hypothetical protein